MSNEIADIRERLARLEVGQQTTASAVRDGFDEMSSKLDKMDSRLRGVEIKSGSFGAVAGGVVSIGVALIMQKLGGKA